MYTKPLQQSISTSQNLNSTADIFTFSPSFPVDIFEFGVILTTGLTASDNLIIKADVRPTAGSDTDRGDGDAGTLTIAAGDSAAAGTGDIVISRPASPARVVPGQQVVLEVTNANTAGVGLPFINFREAYKSDASTVNAVVS